MLNFTGNLNNSNGDEHLQSLTDFYDQAGQLLRSDSVNQKNFTEADVKGYYVRAIYTEPIFKRILLEFSFGKSHAQNNSLKNTFDYNKRSGKFDEVNTALSNNYSNEYAYTNGRLRLRKQTRKYNYALGAIYQQAGLEGKIISDGKDSVISKSFRNILPNARFQYYFSRFKNIMLTYSTSTNQPTASQLQPVPDNSNSVNIKKGNPNLKQEYLHALRLNLSLVNPYKNRNLFAFINYQYTKNKIVNYDRVNALGVDSVKPVNVDGVSNLNASISWGNPLRFLKGNIEISTRAMLNKSKQLLNDAANEMLENNISTTTFSPEVRIEINPTEKLNILFNAEWSYTKTTYSIQWAKAAKYFNQAYGAEINLQLPKSIFFSTDFTYSINNQYSSAFNSKIPLWNASVSKQLLKYNRGELKLAVKDILNENLSVYRNSNQNYVEDVKTNSLKRYVMLSFTYNLTKLGLGSDTNNSRIIMR
ncbi:MAG: hypothetical protein C4308_07055 [Chitinophagaceae bacterium]